MATATSVGLVLLVTLFFFLILGVPIAVTLGISALCGMFMILPLEQGLLTAGQRMFTGTNSFALLAIPFFVLAGEIMNNGGIAQRLINCARVLAGRLPGSLAHTNIVANMLFGAISGSGVAAAAAMGSTMTEQEVKAGYPRAFSAAANVVSGPTGMLIPPSNLMIVYSLASGGTSIAALFLAGYVPGITWGLFCMIVAYFMAKKLGLKGDERMPWKVKLKYIVDAIPSLLLIFIVIGGILLGWFTATEGSAIAVVYALLLSFIYRTIKIKDLPRILLESTKTTCVVSFLIGISSIMSWVMSFTNIPGLIADLMTSLTDNKIIILLIINVLLLIVGCFMDPTPAVLIFAPILLPVVTNLGVDPIHFGIIMVLNLSIGTITPPVGPILFVGTKVAKLKLEEVIKPLMPFFAVVVIVLLLTTYIPEMSLFLPKLAGLVN